VSVLVVTWNNQATLADCLMALRRALPADTEILSFDNHSVDESPSIAERHGARVDVSDSNVGFAAGMNRLAVSAVGDVLVLVNPDVFVHPHAISALLRHFRSADERKVVGGLLLDVDGQPQLTSARPFPTARSIILWLLTRERSTWSIPSAAREVEAVSGAFFATTHELWRELGGFDEAYGHSWEDLDFFWRGSRAGASVWFEPTATGTHIGGTSVRQAPLEIDAFRVSGALRLIRKREGRFASAIVRAALLCRSVAVLVLDALHIHRLSPGRRNRARAFVSLALRGERGPRFPLPLEPEQPA
jgi:GT2 family glycosyltransferase